MRHFQFVIWFSKLKQLILPSKHRATGILMLQDLDIVFRDIDGWKFVRPNMERMVYLSKPATAALFFMDRQAGFPMMIAMMRDFYEPLADSRTALGKAYMQVVTQCIKLQCNMGIIDQEEWEIAQMALWDAASKRK